MYTCIIYSHISFATNRSHRPTLDLSVYQNPVSFLLAVVEHLAAYPHQLPAAWQHTCTTCVHNTCNEHYNYVLKHVHLASEVKILVKSDLIQGESIKYQSLC